MALTIRQTQKSSQTRITKKACSSCLCGNLSARTHSRVYFKPLGLALPQPPHPIPLFSISFLLSPALPRLSTTKMAKKTVLKLEIHNDKHKKRVLKAAAGIEGVDSVAIDMQKKEITVVGDADPVYLTSKLRKIVFTDLMTVGPAKEEKKEEKKPEDEKKGVPDVVYLYDGYSHAVIDENPNACCIS